MYQLAREFSGVKNGTAFRTLAIRLLGVDQSNRSTDLLSVADQLEIHPIGLTSRSIYKSLNK